jgi:hypothetical protein
MPAFPPLLAALVAAAPAVQQVVDSAFRVEVTRPAWVPGTGPLVLVDEGHHNGHVIADSRT